MKFSIRRNWFSIKVSFEIFDKNNTVILKAKSKLLSITKKIIITNSDSIVRGVIKKKLIKILPPQYDIFIDEEHKATVKRKLKVHKMNVDIFADGHSFLIEGDIVSKKYDIHDNGIKIASVEKDTNMLLGTTNIETFIKDKDLILFVIALEITLDRISKRGLLL